MTHFDDSRVPFTMADKNFDVAVLCKIAYGWTNPNRVNQYDNPAVQVERAWKQYGDMARGMLLNNLYAMGGGFGLSHDRFALRKEG